MPANEQPWPKNHVLGIAYHDVEDRDPDQAVVAVRTERLIEQLAWLRENGYQPVTRRPDPGRPQWRSRAAAQGDPAQFR